MTITEMGTKEIREMAVTKIVSTEKYATLYKLAGSYYRLLIKKEIADDVRLKAVGDADMHEAGIHEIAFGGNMIQVYKANLARFIKNAAIILDNMYLFEKATTQISKKTKVIRIRQAVTYGQKCCFDAETTQYWCFEKTDNERYPVRTIKYGVKDGLERIVDMWESGVWFAQNLIDTEYNLLIKLEG